MSKRAASGESMEAAHEGAPSPRMEPQRSHGISGKALHHGATAYPSEMQLQQVSPPHTRACHCRDVPFLIYTGPRGLGKARWVFGGRRMLCRSLHASAHGYVQEYTQHAYEHINPMRLLTMGDMLRCEGMLK